ncbi:MAG TPA: adenylate/guanylate cyclase domain-containing protein [Reyranellaceae bacterium]|nr:adenylate/guanylate cyclase domain-containing protein [Reyranellaceae bacterium]
MSWLFGRRGAARLPVLVSLAILLGALALRAADPPELQRLRDYAFDSFQRLKPREYSSELPVRIVDIDEASLRELGQWPWPRTILAQLIDKLVEHGAAVIAFDIVFAEPDRSSLSQVVRTLPPGADREALERLAASVPDNDRVFAEAIAKAPVVTGFAFEPKGTTKPPKRLMGVVHNSGEKDMSRLPELVRDFVPQQLGAVNTLAVIEAAAKGNGSINPDVGTEVVRRVPMMFRLANYRDEDLFPSLAIEAIRVVQGASTYLIRWSGAQECPAFGERTGICLIRVGDVAIRTDAEGRMALYDTGHRKERYVSALGVLKGQVPADKIEAQAIFIGTSAVGLQDIRSTPLEGTVPGVEVHAQLLEQMLTQTYLVRPELANGVEFIYLGVIGLLFVFLLPRLSAGRMALVAAVFIGAGIAVPWFVFSEARLLFDPIYPPATLATIYVAGSALAFMRTEQERAEIRGAFGLYLSPEVVEQVARNPELLQLGGELREITVMFTDVRGFTTISEQFDPQGLTRFMNKFLTPMTDIIMASRGTIDKYMGDAIMAFWNAPLALEGHAARGCQAALAMQARLRELNVQWKAEAEAEGRPHLPVNFGIGLNTGNASVGNFGSTQRFTYSALSDSVNLASRLEGQCKTYAVGIIIGNGTREKVPDMAALELDLIMVKGKTEPERMFCLVGDAEFAKSAAFRALVDKQAEFLALYRKGAFAEARAMIDSLEAAATAAGWQQGYYAMMRERIGELIAEPPADWTGVYVAKEK